MQQKREWVAESNKEINHIKKSLPFWLLELCTAGISFYLPSLFLLQELHLGIGIPSMKTLKTHVGYQ